MPKCSFPNPSTGLINIKGAKDSKVSVFNATGALVAEYEVFTEEMIDLSDHQNGIYIVMISNGGSVTTKRVAISR